MRCSLGTTNAVLRSVLSPHYFNYLHINPGSLKPHLSELTHIIRETNLMALAVSETWFTENTTSNSVAIPGFNLIRNDRQRIIENGNKKKGGGVAIYLKSGIKFKIIVKSRSNAITEFLFIEVDNGTGTKFALGVVYNPPSHTNFATLENHISPICCRYQHVIILGDFNINLQKDSPGLKKFNNLLLSCGLFSPRKIPTNFSHNGSPSQIDLVLMKDPTYNNLFNQLFFTPTTSHDLIFGSYSISMDKACTASSVKVRNLNKVPADKLQKAASLQNWNKIYTIADIDEQVEILTANIAELLEKFAPLRPIKTDIVPGVPWFTKELQTLIDRRNFYFNASKAELNPVRKAFFKSEYCKLRNEVTASKRKLQEKYHSKHFSLDLPIKKLWGNLRTFGVTTEKIAPAEGFTPSAFNKYFGSVFSKPTRKNPSPQPVNNPDTSRNFNFKTVSAAEINSIISSISTNAAGEDEIPISFIKKLCPFLIPFLTYIINNCITASYFPKLWKIAIVTPIPKIPNPPAVNDFRPISILPCLSKVLERILKDQLQSFVLDHNLLFEFQSGFRPKHSTNTALLKIVDDFTRALAKNKVTIAVFLDFKSAFDIVDYEVLIKKLSTQFRLSPSACSFMKSYLTDRKQRTRIGNEISELIRVTSGTPQGGILSALLFCLFINDFAKSLSVNVHLYADDSTLYCSAPPEKVAECAREMNDALSKIQNWALENKAIINPKKSFAMVISRKGEVVSPSLFIGNDEIAFTKSFKLLGLTLTPTLCWESHINKYIGKINGILFTLFKSQYLVPQATRLYLVKSLVLPLWLYCSNMLLGISQDSWDKLNKTFNLSIRYVYNLGPRDHLTGYRTKILGCDLTSFLKFRSCVFMHNLLKFQQPRYLFDLIEKNRHPRGGLLKVSEMNFPEQRKASFFVSGVHLWNSLDSHLRESTIRTDQFKDDCLKHFEALSKK